RVRLESLTYALARASGWCRRRARRARQSVTCCWRERRGGQVNILTRPPLPPLAKGGRGKRVRHSLTYALARASSWCRRRASCVRHSLTYGQEAVGVDGEDGEGPAFGFEEAAGFEDGGVLAGRQ